MSTMLQLVESSHTTMRLWDGLRVHEHVEQVDFFSFENFSLSIGIWHPA